LLLAEVQESLECPTRTWLEQYAGESSLRIEGREPETLPLPPGAIQSVMTRYGKPVADELKSEVAELSAAIVLSDQSELCRLRFLPRYEVIAKDYLVWRVPSKTARAELSVSVSAALMYLARAWRSRLDNNL